MPTLRTTELIGRDAELEELSSQLGIGAPGGPSGRTVLVGGDAGVGKTRLLMAVRDRALDAGWQVLAGHCLDLADSALPFLPFSEILGRLMAEQPDVVETVSQRSPALARLQPGRRLRHDDPVASPDLSLDRGSVFAALEDLLTSAAERVPLLVVLEDVHWADESTRDLLSFLFTRELVGVSLVVSYRADDLHRRHPLRRQVAEWTRLRGVERMQVEPLGDDDVRHLVKVLHPGVLSELELSSIVDRAQGNPFFLEELVGAASTGAVPGELADLLLVRLDQLDDDTREVARVVSAAGRQMSHDLLLAVSGLDPTTLERALRTAVEGHVLEVSRRGAYSFRHALLGEAVYDDLLPGERSRLHAAFVEALRSGRASGTAAELALHARRSGDRATALEAVVEAGEQALGVGGASEAAGHFLDALELVEQVPDHEVDQSLLVRRCAEALTAAGRVSKAVKVLRARLAAIGPDAPATERGELLTTVAAALLLIDSPESPTQVAATAVDLLRDGPPRLLARALAVHAQCLGSWDQTAARERALEAIALAEKHSLTSVIVEVNTTLAGLGDHDSAAGAWEAAARQAAEAGLVETELRARYHLARTLHDLGRVDEAAEAYQGVIRCGEKAGLRWAPFPAEARALLARLFIHSGRLREAWGLLDVTGQHPPAVYEWLYFAQQMYIKAGLRGSPQPEALRRLREHWHGDGLTALVAGTTELLVADREGDAVRAQAVYDDMVTAIAPLWHERFQARLRLSACVIGTWATAATTMSAEERSAARSVVEQLHDDGACIIEFYAPYDASRGPEYQFWVARRRAENLRWRWSAQHEPPSGDELVAAWRAAEEAALTFGDVAEVARTRAHLAEVLRATGDAAGARRAGDLARETAHALRLEPVLEMLQRAGSASPAPVSGLAALTPRESQILALVAEGRSNGEIGKQLFIATKTVSVHVSNILGKLDATTRTEAAAIARRRGLL